MANSAKIVGITGNIGAGKSVVRQLFEHLYDVPTYDSDSRAKALYYHPDVRAEIATILGEDPVDDGGRLKKELLRLALSDKDKKVAIERSVHRAVLTDLELWIEAHHHTEPMVLVESAILFSSGLSLLCDEVIIVEAPTAVRRERVAKRDKMMDNISRFEAIDLLQDGERELIVNPENNFIIDNDGKTSLVRQVEEIYREIVGSH